MPTDLLLAVSGVFVLVALVVTSSALWWLARSAPEQRRLRSMPVGNITGAIVTTPALTQQIDPSLSRLTRLVRKSPKDMGRLQRRLAQAGYRGANAVAYYALAQLLVAGIVAGVMFLSVPFPLAGPLALVGAACGYLLPGLYIGRVILQRQKSIQNGLPDALDLITICVEAGGGLDQSIAKASQELALAHPALATELRLVVTEIRAGKPRVEAFRNLADRTGLQEIRTLVSILSQTDRFGTSVVQALRTHATTSRTKRRQRAEERAAKVGVKLVFPLALCLFPALYVVCFGPVVVKIYRAFFTSGM